MDTYHFEDQEQEALAFLGWANRIFKQHQVDLHFVNLGEDLRDGIKLIRFIELLTDVPIPGYHAKPHSPIHCLDNLQLALQCLSDSEKVDVRVTCTPQDLYNGNMPMILGLFWSLILCLDGGSFQGQTVPLTTTPNPVVSQDIHDAPRHTSHSTIDPDENPSAKVTQVANVKGPSPIDHPPPYTRYDPATADGTLKRALLSWAQLALEEYEPAGVQIANLGSSFQSGLAFCALLYRFRPDLMPFHPRDLGSEPIRNLELAMDIADSQLGVPPLLNPERFYQGEADERVVATYLLLLFNALTQNACFV